MRHPTGYHHGSDRVRKLKRGLYGFKQAPRCGNARFVAFMKSFGFKSSEADPFLFLLATNGTKLLLLIYVDDGIVVGSSEKEIKLSTEFSFG